MPAIGSALVAAILYIVSFPDTLVPSWIVAQGIWPLAFVFAVPLFRGLDRARSFLSAFVVAFAFGCVWAAGMGYWLLYAMVVEYEVAVWFALPIMLLGVIATHGVIFGAFGSIYSLLRTKHPVFYMLAVPSLWVLFEYAREAIPFMTPWGLVGYAALPFGPFVQIGDIAGIYGVSFLVMSINGGIHFLLGDISPRVAFRKAGADALKEFLFDKRVLVAVIAALVALPCGYGMVRSSMVNARIVGLRNTGGAVDALIIQGNYPNRDRWSGSRFHEQLQTYLGLTGTDDGSRPRLVVWPETVLNSAGYITRQLFRYVATQIGERSTLVAGGVRQDIRDERGVYNTAYMITGKEGFAYYDKNILLPYAETAPFGILLGEYYSAPAEFMKGRTGPSVKAGDIRAGISICFETLYPWHSRSAVAEGAQVLVNISNEAWFGPFAEPELQLRSAAFRALENRRYMLRASNSGISAIISPTGEVLARSSLFKRVKVSGTFCQMSGKTMYNRLGDWILFAAAIVLLCRLVLMIRE